MKFLSDVLAKAGLVVDGVVTFNNTATGQTPDANDNSTKLATTAWVRGFVTPYSLPIASGVTLGGVKVGSGLAIDGTGVLSVSASGVGAIRALQQITATTGQTVFTVSGGYTPGLIDVFLNGVLLTPTAITATNGTTFTLADPAVVNDLLDIFVYNPIYNGFITSTDQVPEGSVNLYFTNTRARAAISLTVTGSSGASTYSSITGVLNVPTYTLDGLGGVPTSRTLTINGVTYDLTANRSWSALPVGGVAGQLLAKVDGTDYNAQWINEAPAASYTSQVKHVVKSSQAITKGQAVYVSSADGTNMIVSKASNATEATSSKTMGLLESTVAINGTANVVTEGLLAGLDTTGANAAGDPVWLGTDGNLIYGLTNKPSAPAHLVFIGVVTRRNANNGEIFVKVQNGYELDELHDLSVKNPSDGDMIKYVASTGLWTKVAASTTNIVEGTNLYYTQGRFDTAFAAKSTTNLAEGTNLYYTDARVGTYLTNNSYATQTYVNTAVSNLVDAAPGTLDTLNELAAALGDDPNFATTVATSIGTKVPQTRTLTINGTTYDLSADRSWTIASGVTSFNTRTGAITSASGDYTTAQVTESGNLYYTDARARLAISLTTTGTSGAATYDNVTGVLNIPQYQGGVTSFNTRTGAITLSSTDVTTALGYTPVTNARTLTINGEAYDLTADRTWTVGVNPSARTIQTYTATASQTTFTVTGGYVVGLVDVFINGVRLTSADFTATNGTTVVLTTGTGVNNIVDVIKYTSAFTASSALRQVTYFTATAGQTTFTVSYTPGLIDVFYNGSKLASSEYTASNGTTVVLTNAAVLNDTLEIIAYAYSVGAFTGQAQLNGTGFVKVSGTTVTYDNSTYLTTSSASSTYQTILTNPVTGTATSGQVAYWSSSSAITGGSNFLFNSSESNLTIDRSLSTLGNAITISKGSDANQAWLAFRQGGGGNGTWRLGYTGDPYDFTINVGTDSSIGTQTLRIFEDSQNVVIGTSTGDNTSRLQVGGGATFTGNVGIGTTTPTASFNGRLSVRNEDAANNPTLVLFKNINSVSTEDIFRVQSWNGSFNTVASIKANGSSTFGGNMLISGNIELPNGANRQITISSVTNYNYRLRTDSDDFVISEAGITDRLRYSYSNVRWTMTGALTVSGAASFSSSVTAVNGILSGTGSAFGDGLRINRTTSNSTQYTVINHTGGATNIVSVDQSGNNIAEIYFGRSINGSTISNSMMINKDGNVGIGTASPASYSRLEVSGTAGAQIDAAQQLVITAPTTTVGHGAGLRLNAASGAKEAVGIVGMVNETSGNLGAMTFHTYAGGANIPERMRITSSGDVRINHTIDFSATFSVRKATGRNIANFSNQTDADLTFTTSEPGATPFARITPSVNGQPIQLGVNNNNVLIGTTTDSGYRLYVNGASYLNGYNYASSIQYFRPVSDTVNPAGGEGVLIFSGGQAAIRMNSAYTMNFDVYNGGTQHTPLQIRQNGNTVRVNSENNSLCLALAFGGAEHGYLGATSGNGRSLLAYSQNGGYVYLSSSSTWVAASDVNRKKNFESYNKGLAEICSLQPTLFNLKTQSDHEPKIAGLIAQQVGEHIQEAFSDGEFIGIDYNVLTVTIINAIKELKAELDELKSKN